MHNDPKKEKKPFMLINELAKIFHGEMRSLAEKSGLNESYRHLLFHIAHHDGINQLELVRITHLKPSTISVTVQRMEAEGYLVRRQDEYDARVMRLYLTDKGREFDEKSYSLVQKIDEKAVKGFTQLEVKTLLSLLTRVEENLAEEKMAHGVCKREGEKE